MSLLQEVELLRSVSLFAKLEPSKLKLLAFTSERITYAPEQEFFHQGDVGDAAYVILEGEIDVIIDTPAGPVTVAKMGKNSIVGEFAILIDVPRTATIKANTKVEALRISKDLFFRMVNEFPEMAVEIMRELARRVEDMNRQLREANRKLAEAGVAQ